MQLKDEYRDYSALRREHDAQIVQIAVEAGLRISPEQWSCLLYGEPSKRNHMESIIDLVSEPHQLNQTEYSQLQSVLSEVQTDPADINQVLTSIAEVLKQEITEKVDLQKTLEVLKHLDVVIRRYATINKGLVHVSYMNSLSLDGRSSNGIRSEPMEKWCPSHRRVSECTKLASAGMLLFCVPYMPRSSDVMQGRVCPRGERCTYAHHNDEIRPNQLPQLAGMCLLFYL